MASAVLTPSHSQGISCGAWNGMGRVPKIASMVAAANGTVMLSSTRSGSVSAMAATSAAAIAVFQP
jgi:hypothetical protein